MFGLGGMELLPLLIGNSFQRLVFNSNISSKLNAVHSNSSNDYIVIQKMLTTSDYVLIHKVLTNNDHMKLLT